MYNSNARKHVSSQFFYLYNNNNNTISRAEVCNYLGISNLRFPHASMVSYMNAQESALMSVESARILYIAQSPRFVSFLG
jgi:hypothetical protein